jgi:hypothetical protein
MVYGVVLGLGFGYAAHEGTPLWFAAYAILLGVVLGALAWLIAPHIQRRQRPSIKRQMATHGI